MRFIAKQGTGGYGLQHANQTPPATPQQATSRWSGFGHKANVLQSLLTEQYQLCCYSELRADQEGLGYHIEHVENKSQNPSRTFDYSNLAASALRHDDLPRLNSGEGFGGHAAPKQLSCDMARFITPHQPDCARFFAYLSDGRVLPANGLTPADQDRARYTIDHLNLNSPYLVNLRRQWWDELDRYYEEHTSKGWSLDHLIAVDLVPTFGALSRFFTLTRQFFGAAAERVLQQQAPALL